jgi:nucleoid-associated protein YgaU
MAVAAIVVLVLLVLLIWFAMRPASMQPGSGTQTAATGQPGTGTQQGAAGTTGAAGQPGTAGSTGAAGATVAGTTTAGAAPAGAGDKIHEVESGQSLWRISRFYYELGSQWKRIFNANEDQIKQPDLIYPKQKFKIPQ